MDPSPQYDELSPISMIVDLIRKSELGKNVLFSRKTVTIGKNFDEIGV
jgi:hypothetical protein